jgi:hypothetical protein
VWSVEPYYTCDSITSQALLFLLGDCLHTIRRDSESEAGIHGIYKLATGIEEVPRLLGGRLPESDAETLLKRLTDPEGNIARYVQPAFKQALADAALNRQEIPDEARAFIDRLRLTS